MEDVLSVATVRQAEENRSIAAVMQREGRALLRFIRRRVKDQADAEDILQDVLYELTEAYRLMKPVEQAGAWLYRVARNRIIDRFRKKKPEPFADLAGVAGDDESARFEDLLPSPDAGPEAVYVRGELLDELEAALDELPDEQREVFVAHEIEGLSFQELANRTGVSVNTLLSRKRYAVRHLRRRLQTIYDDLRSGI
ncbi:MAG TPA: RNA polymerase sigma factor [Bryobacteraceae bacterium]|jgi:RNA polymerase sigma factor (sigma-70 family)|nr:RNA polymerase sigma factor [Bryobacteraceae bacterium]